MLRRVLTKGFEKRHLRNLLVVFFLALAVPTGFLIWQAYSQSKWETFHQHRGLAEELTNRIDANLVELIDKAEARTFADYTFLVLIGDTSANFLQRSVLSTYPVSSDWPGLLGYFQIDTQGKFSTPLLPTNAGTPEAVGVGENEFIDRQNLVNRIRTVLGNNQLVRYPASEENFPSELRSRLEDSTTEPGKDEAGAVAPGSRRRGYGSLASSSRDLIMADDIANDNAPTADSTYSQQAFDKLSGNDAGTYNKSDKSLAETINALPGAVPVSEERGELGELIDLNLNAAYERKSAELERILKSQGKKKTVLKDVQRQSRKEKISLPALTKSTDSSTARNITNQIDLRVNTFESEIDPLEFSLLESGHVVLYRKVWRDGERYIQGMLINQEAFINGVVDEFFQDTAISMMSDLIVAQSGAVLHRVHGGRYDRRVVVARGSELDGTLLYRNRLSAPFSSLELIYTVNHLPSGAGARVLAWVTLVLAIVFLGGFYALYRAGLSQIALGQQQHDFVSAVSHELKTPLTSIRMYGEMLKEGWADDSKKQIYYEFIHDESERLTRLISNVLQLANISRTGPQLEMKPFSLGQLMQTIEAKIANQVQRANFELIVELDDAVKETIVIVDEDCFAQIVINLMDNAIKFSSQAQRKRIDLCSRLTADGNVLLSVRDYGPGIPKDQMRKIFNMFYRSESELTRETVGTGIGLAIVHQLSTAMGAKVDVMNREPGAEFRIFIPVSS